MTVQTSPEPGQYPTAPPWASPPAPAPVAATAEPLYGGLVAPYGSPANKHGQLLVRFPEEVHLGGRPEAPSWRPVVVLTFLFSVLGVISAMRRAGRAKRAGHKRAPYWIAFATTVVAGGLIWSMLVSLAVPLYLNYREQALTTVVQESVLGDGRVEKELAADVSEAQCSPEGVRVEGLRTYLCSFRLAEGGRASLYVRADERGNWELTE